ncbi:formylglycine-generating enzyme required for sulfatase activity [Methylobacterium sp. BE186]|uniref:SUMF1/EgtB/PvdO family nonheme iron enzyme n=1 Tax=Methylobacterium sp. BE186 TaxID=2817715 RepID=UPI00285E3AEE|nr:SUMF1/EgtB/PvdO family nonheme iron enzyme [Methylobacterium sp. BE186]MDR7035792.1 formylglycine-generating enzyme required for sulfatase activity [Methylobacterium sp. BE186]
MLLLACLAAIVLPLVPLPACAQATIGAGRRFALLIANARYPDAKAPLAAIGRDARLLADELRRHEFDVDLRENVTREDMQAVLDGFYGKINAGSAAFLYFGGYGIQVNRQTFLLPVNAQVWSETEVRKDGISLDGVLAEMNRRGARVKIAVVDAARENPYERRFRASWAGLAPVDTPEGTLVLLAAPPGKLVREPTAEPSLFMGELVKELRTPNLSAEEAFAHTRMGVSRASNTEQVPWVSSSLIEEFHVAKPSAGAASQPDLAPVRVPRARTTALNAPPAAAPPPAPAPQPAPALPPPAAAAPVPPPPPAAAPAPAPVQATAAISPPAGPAKAAPQRGETLRDCGDCPEMVVVPAGSFEMGSASTPFDRPVHKVTITKPFAMSATEITVDQWNQCVEGGACKYRPPPGGSGARPITNVSWYDAKDYVGWLSGRTRQGYRLPSEAEWEYAARGGARTAYAWGAQVGAGKANCRECRPGQDEQLLDAARFAPNGFGLFDMAGNAAEWVEDCWNDDYRNAPADGSAWLRGGCGQRVLRGGSFDSSASYVKPSARFRYDADVRYYANGFRVVRALP